MIVEKTSYKLKEWLEDKLSTRLTPLLDSLNLISGFSIENDNNEYYTSREFLNKVKESYKFKNTKFLTSNLNSKLRTTKSLPIEAREKFLNVISDFIDENTQFKKHFCQTTGAMIYPKNGYMGWHNNSKTGWRLYCTYCAEEAKSYFRYEDGDGRLVDSEERQGWNFRLFFIRDNLSPLWHSIYTESERVALGTYLGRDLAKIQDIIGDKQ